MKKFLALVIVVAMTLTLAVNVFAETSATKESLGQQEAEVNVTVTGTSIPTNVYYVVVDWSDVDFTYNLTASSGWGNINNKHDYSSDGTSSWVKSTGNVTVTNHSNAAISVKAALTLVENTGVTVEIEENADTVAKSVAAAVEGTEWDSAASATYAITASGTPKATGKVATVTVTIA